MQGVNHSPDWGLQAANGGANHLILNAERNEARTFRRQEAEEADYQSQAGLIPIGSPLTLTETEEDPDPGRVQGGGRGSRQ